MHFDRARTAGVVVLVLLAGCERARREASDPALIAGGESSEFSGGDIPFGYCPEVVSRTSLDVASEGVATMVALAQGQHEIPLAWQREFPDERIRGFEERTSLLLDVQVIDAEEVVCVGGAEGGYEASGYRARLRRLELAVDFSTADGAVRGSLQRPFVMNTTPTGELELFGGEIFPITELEGTLELGRSRAPDGVADAECVDPVCRATRLGRPHAVGHVARPVPDRR